jgi:hypothetical protein
MEVILQYIINPLILTLMGIVVSITTFFIGRLSSFRKDRKRIYKEQLLKFYDPVYRNIVDNELYNKPKMVDIAKFYRDTNTLFEDNFLLISEELYRKQRILKKQINENDDFKKVQESFNSIERLIQDQFKFLKKKLGYPSQSDWQLMKYYPLKQKIFFSITLFLGILLFLFTEAVQCEQEFPEILPWYLILSIVALFIVMYKLSKLF